MGNAHPLDKVHYDELGVDVAVGKALGFLDGVQCPNQLAGAQDVAWKAPQRFALDQSAICAGRGGEKIAKQAPGLVENAPKAAPGPEGTVAVGG